MAIPAYTLFDANAVTLATFLGSPMAGTWLMALNYRRLGQRSKATMSALAGILVTGAAVLLGYFIPHGLSLPIAIGLVSGMRAAAKSYQGAAVNQHQVQGGRLGSWWAALGVGIGNLVAIMALIFAVIFVQAAITNARTRVTIGSKDEVYFTGSATKEDAEALGEALKKIGYLTDLGVTVTVFKGITGTAVTFLVKEGSWDNPENIRAFEGIGRQIAPSVGGFPIEVLLANAEKETKRQLTVGRASIGKDEIYYFDSATESGAEALGQGLKSAGYFAGKGVTVLLSKGADGTTVSFVVREGWDNPAMVGYFEQLVRRVARPAGGLPIRLRMVDGVLNIEKETLVR